MQISFKYDIPRMVLLSVLKLHLDLEVKAEIVFREKDHDYGFPDRSTRVGL